MSFHSLFQLDQRSPDQQRSEDSWLYCTVCSEYAQIWLISLFGLLRCGPASHSRGGHFENQGMGMTQQQGVATRVSTGTTELGAFGEAEGGEERFEEPNMPWQMKGLVDHSLWGDWMQRRRPLAGHNKDGLDCEREPQAGVHWSGSYTCTKLIFTHSLALFNQQPSRERY